MMTLFKCGFCFIMFSYVAFSMNTSSPFTIYNLPEVSLISTVDNSTYLVSTPSIISIFRISFLKFRLGTCDPKVPWYRTFAQQKCKTYFIYEHNVGKLTGKYLENAINKFYSHVCIEHNYLLTY